MNETYWRCIKWLKSWLLLDILAGMFTTLRYCFKPKWTLQYPKERASVGPRFRGEHALRRYENGEERCIACKLCEVICPAQAIVIESAPHAQDGTRRTLRYDIDMTKCIYCGLCQEACPVDSIVESAHAEFAVLHRSMLRYDKQKLIENGDRMERTIQAAIEEDAPYR